MILQVLYSIRSKDVNLLGLGPNEMKPLVSISDDFTLTIELLP